VKPEAGHARRSPAPSRSTPLRATEAPPRPAARPAADPLPEAELARLMEGARAQRARYLGLAGLLWPLAALAILVLIACLS
jgi:hypothetical protein